jgi:hypothetical protein
VLGKNHQETFDPGNAWHALNPLDLVHGDLCCIIYPSLEGARCVLIFIDDLSCYTWVYFLKYKSDVFEIFKEFRELD